MNSPISFLILFLCIGYFFFSLMTGIRGFEVDCLKSYTERKVDILEAQMKVILWELGNINEKLREKK